MTILVTGGTGLVGSRLLKRFAEAGLDTRALVRQGKEVPAGVEAVEGDILDPASLVAAMDGVTAIVHLAAVLRTPNEDDIWKVNVEGTRNLIAAAKEYAPEARLIMASTGLVYGDSSAYPALETDETTPERAYPLSKVEAEKELRESGLIWSVLRFGFVYGDGDGHLASLPNLVHIFGWHPALSMSLIHQRDIAAAIELALTGAMDGRIVNITDEAPTTLYEICALMGSPLEELSSPLPNPWNGRLDGTLARSLGFQPTVPTVYQAILHGLV
jgi:nucleoside-diphosphate-sugar epimerase